MTDFECNELTDSTVMMVYLDRDRIFLNPSYQRASEIWTLDKKQLLIDSLINGFDLPKFYLHEFATAEKHEGKLRKYAIVDGKQRLSAIWDFMNGEFTLGNDVEYLRDPKISLKNLYYQDIAQEHPTIQARLTGRKLSIITIKTADTDLIEDMFSRLNEAVPLNAAEKRNAFGGPLAKEIRSLVQVPFFTQTISVSDKRYRHFDLACKFLLIEAENGITETKKARLDAFVTEYQQKGLVKKAQQLSAKSQAILQQMIKFFDKKDPLLKSPGIITVYYLLFRNGTLGASKFTRADLVKFQKLLALNIKEAEKDIKKADFRLLEFDRLSQSPNDASALEYRVKVLTEVLAEQ
jgi:hypothetical protein